MCQKAILAKAKMSVSLPYKFNAVLHFWDYTHQQYCFGTAKPGILHNVFVHGNNFMVLPATVKLSSEIFSFIQWPILQCLINSRHIVKIYLGTCIWPTFHLPIFTNGSDWPLHNNSLGFVCNFSLYASNGSLLYLINVKSVHIYN